ncbi:MAG: hypothetical protein R3F19_20730 [Verrucomicrobiales bacterium]
MKATAPGKSEYQKRRSYSVARPAKQHAVARRAPQKSPPAIVGRSGASITDKRCFDSEALENSLSPEPLWLGDRPAVRWMSIAGTSLLMIVILASAVWQRRYLTNSLKATAAPVWVPSVAVDSVSTTMAYEAQEFLESGNAPSHPAISVASDLPAFDVCLDGHPYLGQTVQLTDGTTRIAYFKIGEGLELDHRSFTGQSAPEWEWIRTNGEAGQAPVLEEGSSKQILCRVFIRPADYYNFEFASAKEFLSFRIEDADRRFATWAYARRNSAVGREFVRIFGDQQLAPQDGLVMTRFWKERSMTVELELTPTFLTSDRGQVEISQILADSWLLPDNR